MKTLRRGVEDAADAGDEGLAAENVENIGPLEGGELLVQFATEDAEVLPVQALEGATAKALRRKVLDDADQLLGVGGG